tara:strand:+ start:619 stop:987 length:369 start_codon:yes stop_codon:yes gene_type:complete
MKQLEQDIKVLKDNIKDMQRQLANAHKRILELGADKNKALDELKQEKEMYSNLSDRLKKTDLEAQDKIKEKMDSIPDVLDSKPKTKNFSQPPQPGYRVRDGEKWVKIGADGEMEFEDIEIKK